MPIQKSRLIPDVETNSEAEIDSDVDTDSEAETDSDVEADSRGLKPTQT